MDVDLHKQVEKRSVSGIDKSVQVSSRSLLATLLLADNSFVSLQEIRTNGLGLISILWLDTSSRC